MKIFLIMIVAVCGILNVHAQSPKSKKQEQIIVSGKQKIRKADFDSVWKFTSFSPKAKYFIDFSYNSFLEMPKKVKYWGAIDPLIQYMQANPRQTIHFCAIYAVNPSIESPSMKLQLSTEAGKNAEKSLKTFFAYLTQNEFNNKTSMQAAEIDYRYWLGDDFYIFPAVKEEVIHLGLLVSMGNKKDVFFDTPLTNVQTFKNIKFFPNNSDLIESYHSVIKEIAEYLKTNNKLEVVLRGYSDNSGTETYNINLSKKRAEVIKEELIKLNILPHRIEVIAIGSANPIGDNNTHEGKVANNRVEISIR